MLLNVHVIIMSVIIYHHPEWCHFLFAEFAGEPVARASDHMGQGDAKASAKPTIPITSTDIVATSSVHTPQPKPTKPNLLKRVQAICRHSLRTITTLITGIRPCSIEQDIIDNLRLNKHYGHRPDTYNKTYVKFR